MINKKLITMSVSMIALFSTITNANASFEIDRLNLNHEIIAKYEHGGKGYEAITKDNYGGHSYGKWQISTKKNNINNSSTFESFLSYLKCKNKGFYTKLENAGGYTGAFNGTRSFRKTWVDLAKKKEFQEVYDDFILNTQIHPAYKQFEKENNKSFEKILDWATKDNKIQAGLNSAIIQHGPYGCYRLINKLLSTKKLTTKEQFLEDLYNTRKTIYSKYKNRYTNEYHDLTRKLL